MTSRLIVNSIRHTGASADAITLDNSGNATFPANVTCSGTATGFGKVLQVKQAVKTDTASSTSATFADISGLSVSITPVSTSNKILVMCNIQTCGQKDSFQHFKVLRDSTALGLGTDATGNMSNVSFATKLS